MELKFATDDIKRARAALILYAIYRSRDKSSSLNGLETWSRFTNYIRGACLKSTCTAEFISNFCRMSKVGSIKPCYLETEGGFMALSDGSFIQSNNVKEYKIDIMEDDTLMTCFENEGMLLTMLVRERIQRDKMEGIEDEIED